MNPPTLWCPLLLVLVLATTALAQDPGRPTSVPDRLSEVIEILDLRDAPLEAALRMLAEESGINFAASEEAGKKSVSCFIQRLPARQCLETIAKNYGLWYREDESGVIRVMTAREFERDLMLFRDERTAVFTMMFPNAVDVAVALRNLFGDRVRLSLDRDLQTDEYRDLLQRFQRFDLLEQRGQSLGLLGAGNRSLQDSNGNNLASGLSGNDQSYFRSTRSDLDRTDAGDARATDAARSRDQQAPMTPEQLATLQKAIASGGEGGLDPDLLQKLRGDRTSIYVSILRRNNMIAVRSADSAALKDIENIVRQLDVATPQVLLEVKVLELDLSDDFNSVFDFAGGKGNHSVDFVGSAAATAGNFVYEYVSTSFLARLQLLQKYNRVSALATPTLLVANNEVARLFVGEERPVVRNISSQTTVNQNVVTTSPVNTVELRPVGTTLLITPSINADRTVALHVLQENSDVKTGGATIPVVTSLGTVVNQPVDVVASRSVAGTLIAKDGYTMALGGLVEERVDVQEEGVPGLMDIPLLGMLFRRETKVRAHRELIVLVRPFVLFTATEGQDASRRLMERLSIHPSSATMGGALGTFGPDEPPRPPIASDPLGELLRFQSGLPGGR